MSSKAPEKLFEKAAFGYRTEEVDRYVDQQSAQIRTLEAEKAELMEKMKILAEKVNEYRNEEGALRDALLGAPENGQQHRRRGKDQGGYDDHRRKIPVGKNGL